MQVRVLPGVPFLLHSFGCFFLFAILILLMAKKKQRRQTLDELTGMPKSQLFLILALAFIVAVSVSVLSMFAGKLFYEGPRVARITEVFRSLELSDEYVFQTGENGANQHNFTPEGKRDWTSYASYLRGASVEQTQADLDKKLTAVGFRHVRDSHLDRKGTTGKVYENDRGEYFYVTIFSKQYNDYLQNAVLMDQQPDPEGLRHIDTEAGPVEILMKLNISGDEG